MSLTQRIIYTCILAACGDLIAVKLGGVAAGWGYVGGIVTLLFAFATSRKWPW